MTTAIYRAYDASGALLYVGIAKNWGKRWAQHAALAPFFEQVARLEVRWAPSREAAEKIERQAIEKERPLWNQRYTGRTRRTRFRVLWPAPPGLVGALIPEEWLR